MTAMTKQKSINFSKETLREVEYLREKFGEPYARIIARAVEHYYKDVVNKEEKLK